MIDHSAAWKLFSNPKRLFWFRNVIPTLEFSFQRGVRTVNMRVYIVDMLASAHAGDSVQLEVALIMASNSCSQLNLYLTHAARQQSQTIDH